MSNYKIAVIGGDGTGPEVVAEGLKVLEAVAQKCDFKYETVVYDFGGERYLKTGEVLPDSAIDELKTFDAIYDILRPGGIFILGFNDDIIPLQEIKGLKKLSPFDFKPLCGCSFNCLNGNHTYKFYTKKIK